MHSKKRQRWLGTVIAIGVMAVAASATGPAQAASSNGPYYAEPAWSQKLPTATRFVVLTDWNNEAVLDRETGIVWQQAIVPAFEGSQPSESFAVWSDARKTCADKTIGGRKGWRLPSLAELLSLITPGNPPEFNSFPIGHPFTGIDDTFILGNFWTATTSAEKLDEAWVVENGRGAVTTFRKTLSAARVWCVRGALNAEAY